MTTQISDSETGLSALVMAIISVVITGIAVLILGSAGAELRSSNSTPRGVYLTATLIGAAGAVLATFAIVFGARTWRRARLYDAEKAPLATYAVVIGVVGFFGSAGVALVSVLLSAVFRGTSF